MEMSTEDINWNLCVLCQQSSEESLQCPARSKRVDVGVGYKSLEESKLPFGIVPLNLNPEKLDNGSGIANTPQINQTL